MGIPQRARGGAWWAPYVGLPYADRGRAPRGVDCWGLVMLVYADHGVALSGHGDPSWGEPGGVAEAFAQGLAEGPWRPLGDRPPRALDLVVMTGLVRVGGQKRRMIVHCGVMVDDRRLLHVERETDACVLAIDHPQIAPRVAAIYRHASLSGAVAA